jgi:hypothetical protein
MLAATPGLHPSVYAGALVTTAFVVPQPFLFAISIVLNVVRIITYDIPARILSASRVIPPGCEIPKGTRICSAFILEQLSLFWGGPFYELIHSLTIPAKFFPAIFVFSVSMFLAWVIQQSLTQIYQGNTDRSMFYKLTGLIVSLAVALYLCLTTIVAIPVFRDKTDTLASTKESLEMQISTLPEKYKGQVSEIGSNIPTLGVLDFNKLRGDISKLRPVLSSDSTDVNVAVAAGASQYYYQYLLQEADELARQEAEFSRSTNAMLNAVRSFDATSDRFAVQMSEFFVATNDGRKGGKLTEQHGDLLKYYYGLWLDQYLSNLEQCRSTLLNSSDDIRARYQALTQETATRTGTVGTPQLAPFSISSQRRLGNVKLPGESCAQIISGTGDYLPQRQSLSETLYIFGTAADWLLRTENLDLALITGLLGFGFFGALGASFIRESSLTPDKALPPSGWIMPALVRGVAAATLVFLGAVGGFAAFTGSSSEPNPNPYAVFFTCFIAAVFSENVWDWAKRRQERQLSEAGTSNRSAGPLVQPGAASSMPAHANPV